MHPFYSGNPRGPGRLLWDPLSQSSFIGRPQLGIAASNTDATKAEITIRGGEGAVKLSDGKWALRGTSRLKT